MYTLIMTLCLFGGGSGVSSSCSNAQVSGFQTIELCQTAATTHKSEINQKTKPFKVDTVAMSCVQLEKKR